MCKCIFRTWTKWDRILLRQLGLLWCLIGTFESINIWCYRWIKIYVFVELALPNKRVYPYTFLLFLTYKNVHAFITIYWRSCKPSYSWRELLLLLSCTQFESQFLLRAPLHVWVKAQWDLIHNPCNRASCHTCIANSVIVGSHIRLHCSLLLVQGNWIPDSPCTSKKQAPASGSAPSWQDSQP